MSRYSPLGAFCAGLVAGFAGAVAQNIFFAATRKLAPSPGTDAFEPVEEQQRGEMPTQTVARRALEGLVRRGPLEHTAGAGQLVHHAFGSAWGSVYGLLAGTWPRGSALRRGLQFGVVVWLVSDDILLPAFKLSAWPQHYAVKNHLYAIAAHGVYGAAVAGTFEGLSRAATPAKAALGALWLTRRVPSLLRPTARRIAYRGIRAALPVRDAVMALA